MNKVYAPPNVGGGGNYGGGYGGYNVPGPSNRMQPTANEYVYGRNTSYDPGYKYNQAMQKYNEAVARKYRPTAQPRIFTFGSLLR